MAKKILIVEDELITAADMKFTLEDMGYEVVGTASTGQNAIDIAVEKSPDLVLMDVNLKGKMTGIEASKEIISLNIKVIYLTGQSDPSNLATGEKGACGFIMKPFDPKKLKKAVEEALDDGTEESSSSQIKYPISHPISVKKPEKLKPSKKPEKKVKAKDDKELEFNKAQNLLVVEDEMITALDIKLKLEDFGYNVVSTVKSGEEAINVVENNVLDLILMDITLKGDINGIETTKRIKKDHDIPVIYLTANTNRESIEQAINTNPEGYIPKPFDENELKQVVSIALHKHKEKYN